jgi:hypothetical protein
VHCVVFELTNGRPVSEILAALSKEKGVVLAQPLHEFRAPGVMHAPDLRPGDPRTPPGGLIAPHWNSSRR